MADDDLRQLEIELMSDPERWPVMAGTGGVRKARFAPPSWHSGKSGALRVCYAVFSDYATLYLVTLFAKNEKDNLSAAEKHEISALIELLADSMEKSNRRIGDVVD